MLGKSLLNSFTNFFFIDQIRIAFFSNVRTFIRVRLYQEDKSLTAIVLVLVIAPLFLIVTKRVLNANSFGMYILVEAIGLTISLFTILFFIVSKFITRFINKEEAVHLLKADVTQEKLIEPAPWKLLLSIILLSPIRYSIFHLNLSFTL